MPNSRRTASSTGTASRASSSWRASVAAGGLEAQSLCHPSRMPVATDKVSEEHGAPAHGLAWRPGTGPRPRGGHHGRPDVDEWCCPKCAATYSGLGLRPAGAGEETASVPFAAMLRATEPDDPVRGVIEVSRPDDGLPLSRAGADLMPPRGRVRGSATSGRGARPASAARAGNRLRGREGTHRACRSGAPGPRPSPSARVRAGQAVLDARPARDRVVPGTIDGRGGYGVIFLEMHVHQLLHLHAIPSRMIPGPPARELPGDRDERTLERQ